MRPFSKSFEQMNKKMSPSPLFPSPLCPETGIKSWAKSCSTELRKAKHRLPLHPSQKGRKCCSYREEGKRKTDGKSSEREQVPLKQYNRSLLLQNNRALLWKSKYNQGIDNKDNGEIILWTWSRGLFGESRQVQAPAPSSPLQALI